MKNWFFGAHHIGDYMHRWIFRTPWGSVRLHHILRSDEDRDLHDHPFDFTSILLTGGYTEVTYNVDGYRFWYPRFSVIRRKAEALHRLVLDKPVWTLVFAGPKRRDWGFQTSKGWVPWQKYPAEAAGEAT